MAAYTPEEITEIFEAWADAVKSGTPVSEELAKQMSDATKAARGYARAQEEFGKTLGRSTMQLAGSLYKGEKGVGQFGDAVESAATALQLLILAIPGLGLAAKIGAVAIGALGKAANMAAKQGDALFKSYQDLSRAGATASDGITGVFRNMQNLGYGIEELDKMVQLVTQNSETLAKFNLTAADGTKAFAEGMAQIQRDGQLRALGKTGDDINAAGAAFIRQSVRAGLNQRDIGDKLGAQTKAYLMDLDRLQRLTGMSADAQQKMVDEAMAEDAYNDVMSELKQRALAGDKVAEAQIEKILTMQAKLGKEGAKQLVLSIGGDIEAGSKLFMAMPSVLRNVMDESVDVNTTMNEAVKDAGNTISNFGRLSRLAAGAVRDTIGPLYEQREFYAANKDFDIAVERAKKQTNVQDTATKALSEAQIANMNSRDAMQAFIQQGVAPATVALNALAKGAAGAAGAAANATGAPGGGAATGGAGRSQAGGIGGDYYKKMLYGTGTPSGGATPSGQGLTGKPISGLSPGLAQALQSAAAEYHQLTGRTVEVTSAVRDTAKQAELYEAYVQGRSKFPAAPPGTSKHERGLAVDISQTVADEMDRMGLLKKYGLSRPVPNDPVHLEVSAANGAILSGPMSGYKPNLTMHGTEAIVPLNNAMNQAMSNMGFGNEGTNLLGRQLDKLDEIVRVMQNQVSVSTKILQATN